MAACWGVWDKGTLTQDERMCIVRLPPISELELGQSITLELTELEGKQNGDARTQVSVRLNNLIDNPEYAKKIAEYRKRMHAELKEREDQVLPVFEAYQKDRSVETLAASFAKTMEASGINGRIPKAVDTSKWSDPEGYKKAKQAKKRQADSKRKKKK